MATLKSDHKILGEKIKAQREKRGFMLRDLATKVGVSVSLLSQIETGKTSPSVATLKKISDELGTTIGTLFGEIPSTESGPLMKRKNMKLHSHLAKGLRLYFLANPDKTMKMEALLLRYEGSTHTKEGPFQHTGEEFVTVLKGSITVSLDGKSYVMKKGDTMYFDGTEPHSFKNRSKGISESLHVTTPPSFLRLPGKGPVGAAVRRASRPS